MHIPDAIFHSPRFQTFYKYWPAEKALELYRSGAPINNPGAIPSIQVPPGVRKCGLQGMRESIPQEMIPLARPMYVPPSMKEKGVDPTLWSWMSSGWDPTGYQIASTKMAEPAMTTQVVTADQISDPDRALAWVEDNWKLLAAGMGGLLVLSMAVGGRRR